jgi:hypothetical protein
MLIVEDWFHSTQANLKWNSEYVQCWAYSHFHPFTPISSKDPQNTKALWSWVISMEEAHKVSLFVHPLCS